jgi:hypothetical protein
MPVRQTIKPSLVSLWIAQELAANTDWVSEHGDRFWQEGSVPPEGMQNEDGSKAFDFPYGVWHGQVEKVAQHLLPKEYIGKLQSQYTVRSVRRFDSFYDEKIFDLSHEALREALTGVGGVTVIDSSGVAPATVGYIDQSRFVKDFRMNYPADNMEIVESGIIIEVVWRGVPK